MQWTEMLTQTWFVVRIACHFMTIIWSIGIRCRLFWAFAVLFKQNGVKTQIQSIRGRKLVGLISMKIENNFGWNIAIGDYHYRIFDCFKKYWRNRSSNGQPRATKRWFIFLNDLVDSRSNISNKFFISISQSSISMSEFIFTIFDFSLRWNDSDNSKWQLD